MQTKNEMWKQDLRSPNNPPGGMTGRGSLLSVSKIRKQKTEMKN